MKILKGIPVSPGVVIGRIFVLGDEQNARVPKRPIEVENIDAEVERFERARHGSIEDLQGVYQRAADEMGLEAAKIFQFHIGALADRAIIGPIHELIRGEKVSAEYAAATTFGRWAEMFSQKTDSAFTTKVNDLEDLSRRVIGRLQGARRDELANLTSPVIVASRELTPSQTAGFDRKMVLGFVTDLGGQTGHTAIVARALNLPAVVGCQRMTASATDGSTVIVDGDRGTVVLSPDQETIEQYTGYLEQAKTYRLDLKELATEPSVTRCGVEIEILGNIEFPDEIETVLDYGGSGVGLYRTEFLYLTNNAEPDEETHFESYRRCLQLLDGKPLTIRTVDLGADKYTQSRAENPERNPFLGLRSIRYCLQNLDMFKTQLRAILRASAFGPLKIMFPLITSPHEFRKAKFLLNDAMEDLEELGIDFDRHVPTGMMVEVPSAAIMADTFAREVDFFSIGTNDLVQYTLAVDRTNEQVANLYNPCHPAVIKLIRDVARAGRRREIPVSCCGEAAGDPGFAPLLIGLGLRTLSVTSGSAPALKRLIRSLTIDQCERIARKAISLDSEVEAAAYALDRAKRLVPEAFGGRSGEA
ncbi:MAG: phosphoenolpyruvate--protein phosphotransferase [Planctomycetota bacterium]